MRHLLRAFAVIAALAAAAAVIGTATAAAGTGNGVFVGKIGGYNTYLNRPVKCSSGGHNCSAYQLKAPTGCPKAAVWYLRGGMYDDVFVTFRPTTGWTCAYPRS